MKHDVYLYFKIYGLARDKYGNPDYAGAMMMIGSTDKEIPYSYIVSKTTTKVKQEILKFFPFKGLKPQDLVVITPEEYTRDYENDKEAEDG
jgi:hypothetical protein